MAGWQSVPPRPFGTFRQPWGITQEINLLDIDGQRIKGWGSSSNVPTLPEMFAALGKDGWELVSHVVNQDNTANGVTFHYYNFKREIS